MKNFLIALQFLTTIPVRLKRQTDEERLSLSNIYFPIVGLILGLILAGTNRLLLFIPLEQFFRSVILVILLIVLTGGLHLDGLADTFDALLSRKNKQEMLQIMRDSTIGAMGVLSLICLILLKVALLHSLSAKLTNVSLILMCLLSRFSLVLAMSLFPYAREEGKAKAFVAGMNKKILSSSGAITIYSALIIFRLKGLIIFLTVVPFVILIGRLMTKKIGGITGDVLGAISELTEVWVLFIMAMYQ